MLPFSVQDQAFWKNASDAFGVTPDKLGLWQFVTDPVMWDVIYTAHQKAKEILYSGPGDYPVGLTLALMDFHTTPGGEENAKKYKKELSEVYLERLTEDDFVGVQTYSRTMIGPEGVVHPGDDKEKNQMGEEFYPEALEGTIRDAAKIAGVPVIVTENGLSMEDDNRRVEYFRRALHGVVNCLKDGIDIRGYFCWSAMDNFEWVNGYGHKFGIIEVDRKTMKRTPKPSAYMLGKIARLNRLELN